MDAALKMMCPRSALSTVSSFKAHAKERQDSCHSASASPVSTHIASSDSETVLSGRAVKDVLSVFVLRIFVQDERKMHISKIIFLLRSLSLNLNSISLLIYTHIYTHFF